MVLNKSGCRGAWGKQSIQKQAEWTGFDFCSHLLWLKLENSLLSVMFESKEGISKADLKIPPASRKSGGTAAVIEHYRIKDGSKSFVFIPHLPDRAVVISHPDQLYILPGETMEAFCELPVSLAIYEEPDRRLIAEYPALKLSKTLFGETDSGEIMYSFPKSMVFFKEKLDCEPLETLCPMQIRNNSSEKFAIKRLCVRVEFISVYDNGEMFYTDQVVFTFKGQKQGSQISIAPYRKKNIKAGKKITPAKITNSTRLIKKSFDFFKSIGEY